LSLRNLYAKGNTGSAVYSHQAYDGLDYRISSRTPAKPCHEDLSQGGNSYYFLSSLVSLKPFDFNAHHNGNAGAAELIEGTPSDDPSQGRRCLLRRTSGVFEELPLLLRILAFTAFLIAQTIAWETAGGQQVEALVSQMMATQRENREHRRAFTVKREYQLLDKQSQSKARIVATITYLPPNQREYRIESSQGGFGAKILRDILAKDAEPPADLRRQTISPENYDFQFLGQESVEGLTCYKLGITPRRTDKDLIRGQIWVDAENYRIRRIEGSPMRSPSWWLRDIQILMNFGEIDGMWVRTLLRAAATVRFKGKYVVESVDLEYQPVTLGVRLLKAR
jgi:hypothetical protein